MRCSKCKQTGHTKRSCKEDTTCSEVTKVDHTISKVEEKIDDTPQQVDTENRLSANFWKNTITYQTIKRRKPSYNITHV